MDLLHKLLLTYGHILYRYFTLAGGAFLLFYVLLRRPLVARKLQAAWPKQADYVREIKYSLVSIAVFTGMVFATFTVLRPYTQQYVHVSDRPLWYYVLSLGLMFVLHDAYFYWSHRLMHHPKLFRHVHLVHHKSTNPSPWTSYAFHPLEAVAEAAIIPLIAFLIPAHRSAIGGFLLFQFVYNVYGHLGFEILPRALRRWLNTSSAHNLHHKKFTGNYGLYTLFWDRLMGTLRSESQPPPKRHPSAGEEEKVEKALLA